MLLCLARSAVLEGPCEVCFALGTSPLRGSPVLRGSGHTQLFSSFQVSINFITAAPEETVEETIREEKEIEELGTCLTWAEEGKASKCARSPVLPNLLIAGRRHTLSCPSS